MVSADEHGGNLVGEGCVRGVANNSVRLERV